MLDALKEGWPAMRRSMMRTVQRVKGPRYRSPYTPSGRMAASRAGDRRGVVSVDNPGKTTIRARVSRCTGPISIPLWPGGWNAKGIYST